MIAPEVLAHSRLRGPAWSLILPMIFDSEYAQWSGSVINGRGDHVELRYDSSRGMIIEGVEDKE